MASTGRVQLPSFLARRVLQGVPVLLGIVAFSFLLLHLAPGDIVDVLAGEAGTGDAAYMAALRTKYGLDQPMVVQLWRYLVQIAHLDLGFSVRSNLPVLDLILQRLGPTCLLMVTSIFLSLGLGIGLGTLAALRRSSLVDDAISVLALMAYAMPLFWVGLVLVTQDRGTSRLGQASSALSALVDVTRWEAPLEPSTVFDPPAMIRNAPATPPTAEGAAPG